MSQDEEKITKNYINQVFSQGSSLEKQSARVGKDVLSEQLKIGNNVIVGMGSVVTKDVKDNSTVFGSPAKER